MRVISDRAVGRRVLGKRLRWTATSLVVVLLVGLVVVARAETDSRAEARAVSDQTDPQFAPYMCDGEGAIALDWEGQGDPLRTAPRFVTAWVPAGATATLSVAGRLDPQPYSILFFGEDLFHVGRQELTSSDLTQIGGWHLFSFYDAPDPGWANFDPWTFGTWTNDGPGRAVRFWMQTTGGHGHAGEWTAHVSISGGNGFDGSECDRIREMLGVPEVSGSAGDPVNTATGNFYDRTVEFAAPAGVYGLSFERTYNSMDRSADAVAPTGQVGLLGPGWSTNLDVSLRAGHGGSLVLREADGRRVVFPPSSTPGQWTVPSSMFGSLVVTANANPADERRVLTFASGEAWTFDGDGRLLEMADGQGQKVTVARNATTKVPTSLTASNSAGTGLSLSFIDANADGLLDRVQNAAGERVEFTYFGGRLASVSQHAAGTSQAGESFAYDSSGRLERIDTAVSPTSPPSLARIRLTYDSDGRVITQSYPGGDVAMFAYCMPGQTGCGPVVADRWVTRVVHSFGGLTDETTYYRHDSDGRLVSTTDPVDRGSTAIWSTTSRPDSFTSRGGNTYAPSFDAASGLLDSLALPNPATGAASSDVVDVEYCGRIIIGSDGSAWATSDHFRSWVRLR